MRDDVTMTMLVPMTTTAASTNMDTATSSLLTTTTNVSIQRWPKRHCWCYELNSKAHFPFWLSAFLVFLTFLMFFPFSTPFLFLTFWPFCPIFLPWTPQSTPSSHSEITAWIPFCHPEILSWNSHYSTWYHLRSICLYATICNLTTHKISACSLLRPLS